MATTSSTSSSTASSAIQSAVYKLMANDRKPLERLEAQKTELQSRTSKFKELGSKLSSLLTLVKTYSSSASSSHPLRSVTVSSGDTAAFTVTADGSAQVGSHTIEVLRTATRHVIASDSVETATEAAAAGKNASTGEGGGEGGTTIRFRVTTEEKSQEYTVKVKAGATRGDVLEAISDAINAIGGPVTASVFNQGRGQSRLVLQGATAGESGRIMAVEDVAGSWMRDLGLAGGAGKSQDGELDSTVQSATDAWLRVDGVDVYSAENSIDDLVPGLNLEIHSTTTSAVAVTVERDAETIADNIQKFIAQYNEAIDQVRTLTQAADDSGENRGLFAGDANVSRLRMSLRNAVAQSVVSGDATRSLAELGITTDRQGHLELSSESDLEAAIDADPEGVTSILSGENGIATRLAAVLKGYGASSSVYTQRTASLQTQMDNLEERIERENEYLARRQSTLETQLAQMQSTIQLLTSQQEYLEGLLTSSDSLFS